MAAQFPSAATVLGSVIYHIRDLWFRRIPLLSQFLLLIWAPFACFIWPGLLRNVLLIENTFQLLTLSWICGIAAIVSIALDHLVVCYAPERFHHHRTTRRLFLYLPRAIQRVVLFLRQKWFLNWSFADWVWSTLLWLLATGFSLAVSLNEQVSGDAAAMSLPTALAAIALGGFAALAIFCIAAWVSSWSVLGRAPSRKVIFPSLRKRTESSESPTRANSIPGRDLQLFRGYFQTEGSPWMLEPGHLLAGVYFSLSAIGFAAIAVLDPIVVRYYVSVPFCAVLILLTCATLFGAVAFFMDYFRIPLFAVLLFWVSLFRLFFGADATFEVTKGAAPSIEVSSMVSEETTPLLEFANRRLNRSTEAPKKRGGTLIIATAPGGGIHAAAWSAKVLAGLSQEYRDFKDSLFLISGVSGGSIGSLHYAAHFHDGADANLDEVDDRARTSSLEAIGVALAFRNLPRNMVPISYGADRGVELEAHWQSQLMAPKEALRVAAWSERASKGEVPSLVFGATDVRSGRRVLFATAPIPVRESVGAAHFAPVDFCRLGKDFDISLVSAARMSATFPFVTPIARPNHPEATPLWLADGGYTDNEGIITAIDCIQHLLEKEAHWRGFERILLIRIQPNPLGANPDSAVERMKGGTLAPDSFAANLRWLTGPAEALVNVRSSSQLERSELEVELAKLERDRAQFEAKSTKERWKFAAASAVQGKANEVAQKNLAKGSRVEPVAEDDQTVQQQQQELYVEQWNRSKESPSRDSALPRGPTSAKRSAPRERRQKLIVVQIGFLHPEPARPIPLNWKLSPREQTWYDEAWKTTKELDPVMEILDDLLQRNQPE